jgi:hypothetical protein
VVPIGDSFARTRLVRVLSWFAKVLGLIGKVTSRPAPHRFPATSR